MKRSDTSFIHHAILAGLTPDQEAWLDSVRYANVSNKWPELSAAQSMELYNKVFILSQTTRENNFPYYETGEALFTKWMKYYYNTCMHV